MGFGDVLITRQKKGKNLVELETWTLYVQLVRNSLAEDTAWEARGGSSLHKGGVEEATKEAMCLDGCCAVGMAAAFTPSQVRNRNNRITCVLTGLPWWLIKNRSWG